MTLPQPAAAPTGRTKQIKVVVWDLDHTLWDGVLLEDPSVTLRPHAMDVVRTAG